VIRLAVMMYLKYPLSLRNVEDLLAERGIDISQGLKGRFGDGDGLFFRSFGAGKAYWVYRYRTHGCEREMSLGPYPEVGLNDARAKHAAARKQVIADKADPLAARDAERAKRNGVVKEGASGVPTFGEMANAYISHRTREAGGTESTAGNGARP
jgi:hypothetical protein